MLIFLVVDGIKWKKREEEKFEIKYSCFIIVVGNFFSFLVNKIHINSFAYKNNLKKFKFNIK